MSKSDFVPVFVGGGWRSGTTMIHALLCTSKTTNDMVTECSYFSALAKSVDVGLQHFEEHTRYFFANRDELLDQHALLLKQELSRMWRRFGRPDVLALKDPLLTPWFPRLARILPQARFVVVVRDPRDVVASRMEVRRRLDGGADPTNQQVREQAMDYSLVYRAILDNLPAFGDRLCLVDYSQVVTGDFSELTRFGLSGLRPDLIWRSGFKQIGEGDDGSPYSTELYGRKLAASSLGRYRRDLTSEQEALVVESCGDVARALQDLAVAAASVGVLQCGNRLEPAAG